MFSNEYQEVMAIVAVFKLKLEKKLNYNKCWPFAAVYRKLIVSTAASELFFTLL